MPKVHIDALHVRDPSSAIHLISSIAVQHAAHHTQHHELLHLMGLPPELHLL
jgi:hypothetical protein